MATLSNMQARSSRTEYRSPSASTQPGGLLWPEIRIGREADYSGGYDWDLFLNELGRKNRRRGNAFPLGQVACHYVTDVEMRTMILRKYPSARTDRKEARKIYRDVAHETRDYMRTVQNTHNKLVLECNYAEQATMLGKTALKRPRVPLDGRWESTALTLRQSGSAFRGYEGNRVGIDLSGSRELYEERKEILEYLRSDHKFDTTIVRADWEPHATIFEVHPHLSVDGIILQYPAGDLIPKEITFEAPNVLSDT